MGVLGDKPLAVLQHRHQPIAAAVSGEGDPAVMGGEDFRAGGQPNVDALVVVLFPADGMNPPAVIAGDIGKPIGGKGV